MTGGSAGEAIGASADSVILADRFEIQPRLPIPELSHQHARAFAALDQENAGRKAYALIIEHDLPVRNQALLALKGVGKRGMVLPLGWGAVDWPATGDRRMAIILERPDGRRLVKPGERDIAAIPPKILVAEFLTPIGSVLSDLGDMRVTHRAIRPDNIYQDKADGICVLGECFSAPPGYAQSALYEPLERAMTMREGRGVGTPADDYYALGVTLAVLVMGGSPLLNMTDDEIIKAKMEQGSYSAITGGKRPPGEFGEILRGLLCHELKGRWGTSELEHWFLGRRQNPITPPQEFQAPRGYPFDGQDYKTLRGLARAMGSKWDRARTAASDESLERWIRMSVKQADRADAMAACRVSSGKNAPRMISDDLLIARAITVLDPQGPLRFGRFSAMPDGLGTALAASMADADIGVAFSEMITGMLPAFRVGLESNPDSSLLSLKDTALALRRHLASRGLGFGVERCLYELNPTLQCFGPRVRAHYVTSVSALLRALDAEAGHDDAPIDRHVAAFLAARLKANIDRNLNEISGANRPADAVLGQLRLLALAQSQSGNQPLPNLCKAFFRHIGPAISDYKNLPLRKRIRDAAEKASEQGQLAALLGVLDNNQTRKWDTAHGRQAKARFAAIQRDIKRVKIAGHNRQHAANKLGHKWAASLATLIAVSAAAATIFTQIT